MHIRNPGKVRDGLWYLGHEESGVYLLEGRDESMVISGGMSCRMLEVDVPLLGLTLSQLLLSEIE